VTDFEVQVDPGACDAADVLSIERAVRLALDTDPPKKSADISVALVDDTAITALNLRFLNAPGPTDVLAFSLGDRAELIGDVYVGFEQAARQAAEVGVSLQEELVRLAVHGTLHVLGYDHPVDEPGTDSPMFVLQERLVREAMDART
jgi:probable rRNA maturation factor